MNESLAGRWLRRYKLFFFLGILLVCVQIFLACLLPIFGATDDILLGSKQQQSLGGELIKDEGPKVAAADGTKENKQSPANVDDEDNTNSNSNLYAKSKLSKEHNQIKDTKRFHLRLEELDFQPSCDIFTKEAVSAIHRAQTQQCKGTIANITCAIQAGTFYASSLPNYCPNRNFMANRSLGCYKDEKKFRILSGYYTNFKTSNTPSKCIQMCLQSGFVYAGVQYGTECFCGNTEPTFTTKLPDPKCNYKCVGEPKQICGGYFTINVYETGISKFVPQVAELIPKDEEKKVKIAFLLTLNGRAIRQVHRLLKSLYSKSHFYYIHVDARQDYMYRELLKLEKNAPNIRLARERFSTIWGGASLLKMLLTSMTELLTIENWQWDFVINLSESDFLVKTTDKLVDFLTANKDRNFVKSHGREVQRFIQKQGLDKTFVECDTHMWRIGDRELPNGIQIDGGSDWIALSRPFVEYVTCSDRDDLVTGLLKIFNHTLLPAESFFHTALRNSQFCNTYVDNNLHVTNWKRRLGCKCQYKHVVDWCGCSPNDFKPDDWQRLQATEVKQIFFARKFEAVVNQAVILKLEEWLYGPARRTVHNVNSYWQSIYNWEDKSPPIDRELMQITKSIMRLKLSAISLHHYEFGPVKEITTYMDNDHYNGFLILFEVDSESDEAHFDVEIWAKPQQVSQASRSSKLSQRIKRLEVSSDFDQKEQISRNFAKILGTKSELVIILQLSAISGIETTINYNMTVLWINPTGKLSDISDLHVEDSGAHSVHFSKSNLKQPLIPGVWIAKIIHRKSVMAQCSFLIVPIESPALSKEDFETVKDSIVTDLYVGSSWNTFRLSETELTALEQKAIVNLSLVGLDLQTWIDSLVARFYKIVDICVTNKQNVNSYFNHSLCHTTNWSSLAPDPKSVIQLD